MLLKKDSLFLWQEKHQKEFDNFKEILNRPLSLKPFVQGYITRLYVDYSKHCMGLVLTQQNPDKEDDKRVIWCDSTSLTLAQAKYSSIYGEHTALVWAILKCRYWLRGIPHFTVMTDQIALSHIYLGGRELSEFPEELRNLAEATLYFKFIVHTR